MTVTEKSAIALVGKTFSHFYQGNAIAEGIVVGMSGPNHIQLALQEGGKEEGWFEIYHLDEVGYDRLSKTGFRFSLDNPHREEFLG